MVKRELGNAAAGGGGGGKVNANAPPGPVGATRDWDAAWASREQKGAVKFKGEPDRRVRMDRTIKGEWILDFSRWSICEQTAHTCWKRHVRAEKQCGCQMCQRSKAWPPGVDEALKPDGWSDQ